MRDRQVEREAAAAITTQVKLDPLLGWWVTGHRRVHEKARPEYWRQFHHAHATQRFFPEIRHFT